MNLVAMVGWVKGQPRTTDVKTGKMTRFTITVKGRIKNAEGNYKYDYINCVSFGRQSEYLSQYVTEGDMVSAIGYWNTRTYSSDDGTNKRVDELVVDNISTLMHSTDVFEENRKTSTNTTIEDLVPSRKQTTLADLTELEEDLPF